jgi:hypothetical protein
MGLEGDAGLEVQELRHGGRKNNRELLTKFPRLNILIRGEELSPNRGGHRLFPVAS